jgi:hypothetical protein
MLHSGAVFLIQRWRIVTKELIVRNGNHRPVLVSERNDYLIEAT